MVEVQKVGGVEKRNLASRVVVADVIVTCLVLHPLGVEGRM